MSGYIGQGVIDIGQGTREKWERMFARRWGLNAQRNQVAKAMTFRSGNDGTLETTTLAILPVGIAGVNGALMCVCGAWGSATLIVEGFLRDLGCHIDLGREHLFF